MCQWMASVGIQTTHAYGYEAIFINTSYLKELTKTQGKC